MLDKTKTAKTEQVGIAPPRFATAQVTIRGTAPLCVNNFSSQNRQKMVAKQLEGSRSKKGTMREAKDFNAVFEGSKHISTEGWEGFPASAFRAAMISACRTVGFQMTRAKLSLFVEADGIDAIDGQPLVRIHGKSIRRDHPVKLANGATDIVSRSFHDNWSMKLTLKWDSDQFSASDIINLLSRAGVQVGIGAGRPDSKNSSGMGWGTFSVES